LHLTKPKKSKSSSTSTPSSASTSKRKRQPLDNLDNETIDNDSDSADTASKQPPSPKPYDDELLPAPAKHPRSSDTIIDVDNEDDDIENEPPKKKKRVDARDGDRNRSISAGSSSGGRRASRDAEAGNQIARGLKIIGEGMSAPLVTKADTSHVDAIVDVFLADPTLLPADPEGEYYALFLDALSANEMRVRVFIKTQNRIQRIALLKRVLTEKGVDAPFSWV
jgi:hypothetical protein